MYRDLKKYEQAIQFRESGKSIRTIAKELRISSSTASIWCRSVELTEEQKELLSSKSQNSELLRLYAKRRHEEKVKNHSMIFNQSKNLIRRLTSNELLLTGIALYWAEGFKSISEQRIGFCNSDPRMIKFMVNWFKKVMQISVEDFTLRAEFNIEHKSRLDEIEDYWAEVTGISRKQFSRPYFQKAKLIRDYSRRGPYFGVLRIRIRKSTVLMPKLKGWIEGLSSSFSE